jgi:hypothetical protein
MCVAVEFKRASASYKSNNLRKTVLFTVTMQHKKQQGNYDEIIGGGKSNI